MLLGPWASSCSFRLPQTRRCELCPVTSLPLPSAPLRHSHFRPPRYVIPMPVCPVCATPTPVCPVCVPPTPVRPVCVPPTSVCSLSCVSPTVMGPPVSVDAALLTPMSAPSLWAGSPLHPPLEAPCWVCSTCLVDAHAEQIFCLAPSSWT